MVIKTKNYKLESNTYVKLGMTNIIKSMWWVFLIPAAIVALTFIWPSYWFPVSALIITILYLLFWIIQFAGIAQLPQYKTLFEKLSYEIDSRKILIKLNAKQGMPINWDQVTKAIITKDAFVIFVTKAQIIHLPFKIFPNQNEIKFMESILNRKGFVK